MKFFDDDDDDDDNPVIRAAKWYTAAYQAIPEYDLTNYDCLPVGMTETGKVIYLINPPDFGGKLFGAMAWKLLNQAHSDRPYKLQEVTELLANENPMMNTSPYLKLGKYAWSAVQGRNPVNDYNGRGIVSNNEWNAGLASRSKALAREIWNTQFGYVLWKIPGNEPEKVMQGLEKTLDMPIAGTGLRRLIRVSDKGLEQKYQRLYNEKRVQDSAIRNLAMDELLVEMVNKLPETALNLADVKAMPGLDRAAVNDLRLKLEADGVEVPKAGQWRGTYKQKYKKLYLERINTAESRAMSRGIKLDEIEEDLE